MFKTIVIIMMDLKQCQEQRKETHDNDYHEG